MTPASDRKPRIGDRVWLERDGQRHEGVVSDAGGSAGAAAIAANAVGYFSSIGKRLGLYPHAFGNTWGFLDPAPEAPKPYVPMVGDVIDVRVRVEQIQGCGAVVTVASDPVGCRGELRVASLAHALLVSRSEKPLQVGEKALTADSRRVVEIVSIFERRGETFATVEITDRREYEVPFDTVRLDDLRRAPEGV